MEPYLVKFLQLFETLIDLYRYLNFDSLVVSKERTNWELQDYDIYRQQKVRSPLNIFLELMVLQVLQAVFSQDSIFHLYNILCNLYYIN